MPIVAFGSFGPDVTVSTPVPEKWSESLFVALLSAPPVLLLFGLVDAAGAVWTWHAVRHSRY